MTEADWQARLAERDAYIAQQDARIAQQDARIAQQDARIAQQDARIAQQDARIAQLEALVLELRAQLNANSTKSNRPAFIRWTQKAQSQVIEEIRRKKSRCSTRSSGIDLVIYRSQDDRRTSSRCEL